MSRIAIIALLVVATSAVDGAGRMALAGGEARVRGARAIPARVAGRVRYHARKLREMPRPDRTVLVAAAARTLARLTGRTKRVRVRLADLYPVHGVMNQKIDDKIERRAAALEEHAEAILAGGILTQAVQDRLIPSKNAVRVIRRGGGFVVVDGNSRLRAIQRAFPARPDLDVDVELIDTRSPAVQRLLGTLLRMRKMPSP